MIKKIGALSFVFLLMFSMLAVSGFAHDDGTDHGHANEAETEVESKKDTISDEVSIIPGDAFYPLKRAIEALGSAITFGEERKIKRELRLANERALETRQLVLEERREELIEKSIENYEERIEKARIKAERLAEKNESSADLFIEEIIEAEDKNYQIIAAEVKRDSAALKHVERLKIKSVERREAIAEKASSEIKLRIKERIEGDKIKIKYSEKVESR